MSKKSSHKNRNSNINSHVSFAERGIGLGLASAVLVTFIILVLNPRIMNNGTLAIIRFLAATFAGISGYFFVGNLGLEARIDFLNKSQIRATGTFATFIITLFFFFVGVPSPDVGVPSPDESTQNKLLRNDINFIEDDFQTIKVVETEELGWEDESKNLNKYVDCFNNYDPERSECLFPYRFMTDHLEQAKYIAFGLAQDNPVFDITFVNSYSTDLTITKVGTEIIDSKTRIWYAGTPEPEIVNVAQKYTLDVPDNICPPKPWEEEEPKCDFPKLIEKNLDDPLFLTPGSVFRYNLELKGIGEYTPNSTLVRFYLYTNAGIAYSSLVYIQQ